MLAIGLLALGLRFLYATEYITHPLGRLLWVDEIVYWERARAILGGRWLPDRPFFQDPLIHYLLAGVMSLLGTEVITIRVALVCVGALTPVVTYWVGQRTLGRTEGIIAGLGARLGISIQVTSMDDQSVQVASIRPQCSFAPIPAA